MQITFIVFMLSKIWARSCIDNFILIISCLTPSMAKNNILGKIIFRYIVYYFYFLLIDIF